MQQNKLGLQIHQLLQQNNLENPMIYSQVEQWNNPQQLEILEQNLSTFLSNLCFDMNHPSIKDTPKRMLHFFINHMFFGLNYNNFPECTMNQNEYQYHAPILTSQIPVISTCEHHLVDMQGIAVVGYIPNQYVMGLSNFNKIINFFAKRPQIQERLTLQIFVVLKYLLQTSDVAIAIKAQHKCVSIPNNNNLDVNTLTVQSEGKFLTDQNVYNHFYNSINQINL